MKKANKKGFTLVELLAVIVILAVIAIITTPMILGVIDKAKKGAFQSSVKGIEDSIELQQLENEGKITNYTVVNGVVTNTETNEIISTKGGTDINGNIKVKKDGRIIYALNNGKECIIKRDGQEEIEQIPDIKFCTMEVATNLVKNGYGEYGDNTNFSELTYENGALRDAAQNRHEIYSDEYIKIDENVRYYFEVTLKGEKTESTNLLGFSEYDADMLTIGTRNNTTYPNTLTYLTEDLKPNDTIVHLNDLSIWNATSSDSSYTLGLIFWNYQNSSGYLYPENTYSRNVYLSLFDANGINKENHTITLSKGWSEDTIPKNTKVSRTSANFGYNYQFSGNYPREYETKGKKYIAGMKANEASAFKFGTQYIKILLWDNYNNFDTTKENNTYYKNIIFREAE